MNILLGCLIGFGAWAALSYLFGGFYTVDQNERAVKTSFGRAERVPGATTLDDPLSESLDAEEKERYSYPQVRVIPPGGAVFQMALGESVQGVFRHRDLEHGLRSR